MRGDSEFSILMQRLREGSQDAAKELFERYGPHILVVIRRRLSKKLRSKFDSDDFTQAVWASFFALPQGNYSFDNPKALIGFLVKIARGKVIEAVRQRFATAKYNVNREHSLEGSAAFQVDALSARQPTPSQVAVAKEQWDRLQEKLPTHQRRILELLRQGYTHEEIADRLDMNERTIRRLIRRIAPRNRLDEQPNQERSGPPSAPDSPLS
jgi:RNA polymerase sigma-70 factor (ECF subfamily)